MAKRYRTVEEVGAPASEVLGLMIDVASQEALLKSLGTPEVKCTVREEGNRVRVSVDTAEPALKGAGIHRATLEMDWDLAAMTCSWVRHDHTFGERVQASGTTRVEARGEATCVVVEEGTVDVAIPVIGGRIAKTVVAKLEAMAPQKAAFWTKRLAR